MEAEEQSAAAAHQDLVQTSGIHEPDLKKRTRIKDDLFQGLMKVCLPNSMAMHTCQGCYMHLPPSLSEDPTLPAMPDASPSPACMASLWAAVSEGSQSGCPSTLYCFLGCFAWHGARVGYLCTCCCSAICLPLDRLHRNRCSVQAKAVLNVRPVLFHQSASPMQHTQSNGPSISSHVAVVVMPCCCRTLRAVTTCHHGLDDFTPVSICVIAPGSMVALLCV